MLLCTQAAQKRGVHRRDLERLPRRILNCLPRRLQTDPSSRRPLHHQLASLSPRRSTSALSSTDEPEIPQPASSPAAIPSMRQTGRYAPRHKLQMWRASLVPGLLMLTASTPKRGKEGMESAKQYGDGYPLQRLVENGLILDDSYESPPQPSKSPHPAQRTTRHSQSDGPVVPPPASAPVDEPAALSSIPTSASSPTDGLWSRLQPRHLQPCPPTNFSTATPATAQWEQSRAEDLLVATHRPSKYPAVCPVASRWVYRPAACPTVCLVTRAEGCSPPARTRDPAAALASWSRRTHGQPHG